MERLPVELCQEIVQYLCIEDVKSIRLVSTSWAHVGQDYLIPPTYLSLPHRDDFSRLLLLSKHPSFASRIETLEMDMGEMNEYHARHNTYFVQYMKDSEERDHDSQGAWGEYAYMKGRKEAFSANYCSLPLLEAAFKNLPNLKAIDVRLTRCPFQHPLLQRTWRIPSTRLLARVSTTERFSNIISAARNLTLESLTHDCLPFEFWGQRGITSKVNEVFKDLTSMKICLDYSVFPNLHSNTSFSGLRSAFHAAPKLRTLHLGFANSVRPRLKLSECIGDFTWRNLHTLGLEGVTLSEDDVAAFLKRHATTIKRLQLGLHSGHLSAPNSSMENAVLFQQGTQRGLLAHIREMMALEQLNMRGEVMEESTSIRYNYEAGLYDDDWVRLADNGPASELALAAERFVLEGVDWHGDGIQEEALRGL